MLIPVYGAGDGGESVGLGPSHLIRAKQVNRSQKQGTAGTG